MYQDLYKINNTSNLDQHSCFHNENTYPNFQKDLKKFKFHITELVDNKASATFYKFGDGDYRFLNKQSIGSASPGKRALSKSYNEIDHDQFMIGAQKCDYYTCEIYPENRNMFHEVINNEIDYPAEYGYGLVANKWFFEKFKGRIGLLGASEKLNIIKELLQYKEYQAYLGLESFTDYIHFPQKYAADDIELVEQFVGDQLKNSTADIFLLGIGHAKSGVLHAFKKYKPAVYLDVGAGIDMLAGCINTKRPFAGDWKNFRLSNRDYSQIDYLNYNRGNEKYL
jgi:hypothetical protein